MNLTEWWETVRGTDITGSMGKPEDRNGQTYKKNWTNKVQQIARLLEHMGYECTIRRPGDGEDAAAIAASIKEAADKLVQVHLTYKELAGDQSAARAYYTRAEMEAEIADLKQQLQRLQNQ